MKKKRVLLISCTVILLCVCIITGMSYALFTDGVSVKNHLKAGNLDVTLTRTGLVYNVLNEDGELEVYTVNDPCDFTNTTSENVFGIDSTDIRIVPGSYFDATMEIAHGATSNTAFQYSIEIKLIGESNALAEQLKVTITDPDGNVTTKMLSELAQGLSIPCGKMKVGAEAQSFKVRVDFVDDVDYNQDKTEEDELMDNDEAQEQSVVFDLVITAVQATAKENP